MKRLNIEDLQKRRSKFTLKFAKLNSKEGKLSHLFEKNPKTHTMKTRHEARYLTMAHTKQFQNSPILHMQKLLKK